MTGKMHDITPELIKSRGIEGNLVLVTPTYFVVDATRYAGTKRPEGGLHRLVAYCRCCFSKMAAATHRIAHEAFKAVEAMVGRCKCYISDRIDKCRGRTHAANNGKTRSYRSPSLGIGG